MKALWLEPGCAPVNMTLDNKSVSVREGALHGHYHWYTDDAQGEHHLMLAFCEKKETAMKFENQTPFHMKHVGGNVYRNYNRSQILVFQNMYKDVGEPESQEPDFGKHDGFRCASSFVYMHPGSPESTLRIGFDKHGECKVSWQGGETHGLVERQRARAWHTRTLRHGWHCTSVLCPI